MTLEQAINYAQENADAKPASPSQEAQVAVGGLTVRERAVVALIAQGQSNREIASKLTITERTVEAHIRNIRSKLNATSRTQIAVWAVEHGLDGR